MLKNLTAAENAVLLAMFHAGEDAETPVDRESVTGLVSRGYASSKTVDGKTTAMLTPVGFALAKACWAF